jgi:DNA helicase-2/ATP-dependent DNA helicase PcrA
MRWTRPATRHQALQDFEPPASAQGRVGALADAAAQLNAELAWPADMEIAKGWYLPALERMHDDAGVRKLDVEQLARLAAGYASASAS